MTTQNTTMKSHITLSYSSEGLQPPVFVVSSLSETQWEPVEMHFSKTEDGHFHFSKEFEAEEGEHQYKYRLGYGDWWALDESKQIVDDGSGNRNNVIVVEAPRNDSIVSLASQQVSKPVEHSPVQEAESKTLLNEEAPKEEAPMVNAAYEEAESQAGAEAIEKETPATHVPLFRHETSMEESDDVDQDDEPSHYNQKEDDVYNGDDDEASGAPLMRHETSPSTNHVEEDSAPLLRHETVASKEPEVESEVDAAPLFRHESIDSGSPRKQRKTSSTSRSHSMSSDSKPDVLHPDTVIEKLPTEHNALMAHLERVSSRLSDDDTVITGSPSSPAVASVSPQARSVPRSASDASSTSIPQLGAIHEDEEEGLSAEASAHIDQVIDFSAVLAAAAADRDGKLGQLSGKAMPQQHQHQIHHHHALKHQQSGASLAELLTPPMTPDMNDNNVTDQGSFAPFGEELRQAPSEEMQQRRKDRSTDNFESKTSTPASETPSKPDQPATSLVARVKGLLSGVGTWFVGLPRGSGLATGAVAIAVGVAAVMYRWREARETVA